MEFLGQGSAQSCCFDLSLGCTNARCLLHIKLGWAGDWTCVPVLPRWHWSHWVRTDILEFIFFFLLFFCFYFPTVQQGDQVILTCIHYNYIFPTLSSVATWVSRQSSQCYSAGSPCKSILSCVWKAQAPDPSHSLPLPSGSHKSFLQVRDFLFLGDVHLCWILDSSYKWYHMVFVFVFLAHFTQYEIP